MQRLLGARFGMQRGWVQSIVMIAGWLSVSNAPLEQAVMAADWPMWRYGPERGAVTPQAVPDDLRLSWSRQLPVPLKAWPVTQPRLQFDEAPQPVVSGQRIFVPCTVTDSLSAYSTRSGERLWRFQTDGPVRFAPLVDAGRVYCVSDDGYLYCLDAADGSLKWRFNGGPADRRVLGNGRLVSSWPARGGVVLHDQRLFFAASIWPFMGVFLHAVDPQTGEVLWTNSGDGTNYTIQPHGTPSFATIAPQGHLVAVGDSLIVPGGRSVPAVFETNSGRFRHFEYYNKGHGGHAVMAGRRAYFVGGQAYDLRDGTLAKSNIPTFCGRQQVVFVDGKTVRIAAANSQIEQKQATDRVGKKKPGPTELVYETLETHTLAPLGKRVPDTWLFQSGRQLWGVSGTSTVVRYDLPPPGSTQKQPISPAWQATLEGTVVSALAADDRLFVVTNDARLHCFASGTPAARHHELAQSPWNRSQGQLDWRPTVDLILDQEQSLQGIAVCLGVRDGGLVRELLARTQLSVIAIDPDPDVIRQLRSRLVAAGWYGHRASAHVGNLADIGLPPYLARLVISEHAEFAPDLTLKAYSVLRPYGGAAFLPVDSRQLARLTDRQVQISTAGALSVVRRAGALPGAGQWTHQYGNAAQSGVSRDRLVKAPLGLLWFGGVSHAGVLPRHGHGPSPQVAGGRLVIEGADFLRCVDVYTGRLLWQKSLPQLGAYHNVTSHFSGASEVGSNYVTIADRVYVVYGTQLLELDAETGETLFDFSSLKLLSATTGHWGFLAVQDNLLVVTAAPMAIKPPRATGPEMALSYLPSYQWSLQLRSTWRHVRTAIPQLIDVEVRLRSKLSLGFQMSWMLKGTTAESVLNGAERLHNRLVDLFVDPGVESPASKAAQRTGLLLPANDIDSQQYSSSSRRLIVFDRQRRKVLWQRDAKYGFRHNNIAIGNQTVFCIDGLSPAKRYALSRRGAVFDYRPTLYALQGRTGRVSWSTQDQVAGTFLNYSAEHDLLIQGGSKYRDRALDESGRGIIAYRGQNGTVVWKQLDLEYGGPCLLQNDTIFTNGNGGFALDIQTGEQTGWKYSRAYGCNTAIASQHLLTFRSGAAGFCDLLNDAGTGNLGGFRSSCTNNLIPADGVLSAPDYTRTCVCSYQNQASLALIHMPEAEFWTFGAELADGRLGVNFGAPGDRRSPDGTLWLDYPSVGGSTPKILSKLQVDSEFEPLQTFRQHASVVQQGNLKWVASSGVRGLRRIELPAQKKKRYVVRLVFLEPDNLPVGKRVFDISVEGAKLAGFDIVRAAQGSLRQVTREFVVATTRNKIEVQLTPRGDQDTVLSGIELVPAAQAAAGN